MNYITILAFVFYLTIVASIALVAYRVTNNLSDFVLGGRQLGGAVAALSAGASDMSAWLILGLPGLVFAKGLNQIWLPIGLTIGAYCSWRFIAKPLRVFSEFANDSLTLPAFLDNRFLDNSGLIRILLSSVMMAFLAFYMASGLVGGAILMQRFNLSYDHALLLGTSIIVAYTFIGGFLAVSWTDFFQGSLMLLCLLIVPVLATIDMGGWQNIISGIAELDHKKLDPLTDFNLLLFVNLMAWGLGYFGQPHILVRFMAVRTVKDIALARRVCISWMSLSMLGAVLTGFVGIVFFLEHNINYESIFIIFSEKLFSPWVAGVLFAAILSSIMCALDSQMLASSSAVTEDLYHRLFRKKASQKELVWFSRVAIILIAMVSMFLARKPDSSIVNLVSFAWAGLGAAFGPAVICSLFWRNMSPLGAMLGIIFGASTVFVWKLCAGFGYGGVFVVYEIIPGFIMGFIGIIIGSKILAPSKLVVEQFDNAWEKISSF